MVKYPDNSTGIASSSSSDQVTYTYNTRGEVITRTDQNATVHTYGYDGLGDQLDEWVVPGSGVDDVIVHIHSTYSGYFTNTAVSYNGSSTITDTVQRFYNSFGQPPALQRPDARPPPLPTPFHALRLYLFPGEQKDPPLSSAADSCHVAKGAPMRKVSLFIALPAALLVALAILPVHAADNMKAFPPAEAGMVRYVLQLPAEADESTLKVELIAGKTVLVDAGNSYFFGGKIEEDTIDGWGFPRYHISQLGPMAGPLNRILRLVLIRVTRLHIGQMLFDRLPLARERLVAAGENGRRNPLV